MQQGKSTRGKRLPKPNRFQFNVTPFYFLRHGETDESQAGIVMGQSESHLNATGLSTVEKAAELLRDKGIQSIYASPLLRSWQSASIVSERIGAPVNPALGLKERYWGLYEGRPAADRPATVVPGTAEPIEAFSDRVLRAMQAVSGPAPILVVAHSGVFRVLSQHAGQAVPSTSALAIGGLVLFEPPGCKREHWLVRAITE